MEYMSIGYILISILLGVIPEVLFFTLFFIYTKKIEEKKFRLFLLIFIAHLILILFNNYKIINYIVFMFFMYFILKILYKKKTQIIDVFIINISYIYVFIISCICFSFVKTNVYMYYIMLLVNRLLLFIPFIFKSKFNILYKKYCNLWNRNYEKKQPIKSITLRNISLISLNIFIFLCNMVCLYIFSLKG